MKKGLVMVLMFAVVAMFSLMMIGGAHADDVVAGYLPDTQIYPDMLNGKPDCQTAYNNYLTTLHPLQSCLDLADAQTSLKVQEALLDELKSAGKCPKCKKQIADVEENISAYQEQVKVFQDDCPNLNKRASLSSKLDGLEKQVCKSCSGKWPGNAAPDNPNPCK
jgi:hypothetical protein